ncbi:MAG: hypothetical protein ACI9HK_001156 [Pirellulaceae bacterium]|jgi:hypothetical protein
MTKFDVFYMCYSTEANVDSEVPVPMDSAEIGAAFREHVREQDDFFGVVDAGGVVLQVMRNVHNRCWIEIPSQRKQGSYGRHTTIDEARELLANLPSALDSMLDEMTFQKWSGGDEEKNFAISAEDMQELVKESGGCFATDFITVSDRGVGYMYREEPDFDGDTGWRFFSGEEDDEYLDDPMNTGIYELNDIANFDPDIIPHLQAPPGSSFERDDEGMLVPIKD